MAHRTRTSTRNGSFSPTRRISPDSRNRKQLDLDALVELADLVEEQRAAVGDLEESLAVGVGAGEGPLAVAEELALDQVFGQGAAVDRDEGPIGAAALVVEAARDQLLARAGLAQDHDRGVGGGDGIDQPADLLHGRASRRSRAASPRRP